MLRCALIQLIGTNDAFHGAMRAGIIFPHLQMMDIRRPPGCAYALFAMWVLTG